MIKEFRDGMIVRWTGPKERQKSFNPRGEMDFILDGKPHKVNRGIEISASFYDSSSPNYLWCWYSVMQYIEEVTMIEKGTWVYVSDESEKDALRNKWKRRYLANVGGKRPHVCVDGCDSYLYPDGDYETALWEYVVPVPEQKTITLKELFDKAGVDMNKVVLREEE